MSSPVYLSAMGMACALGFDHQQILENLLHGDRTGMVEDHDIMTGRTVRLGKVSGPLPAPQEESRNNRLLLAALEPVQREVDRLKETFGSHRIGVILGSSTSGTLEAEEAMTGKLENGSFPKGYSYRVQEMGDPSRFLAQHLNLEGPAYTVSTACSSSGKVFQSARNLIRADICDAVIVGGADSLCRLTVHGFSALESVADNYCQPFSEGRDGINIGEGAALFTMTREESDIVLAGIGESSDAWHISAPHPEGRGAAQAMKAALDDAVLGCENIGYLNLHGTATPLNDAMEGQAVQAVFPRNIPCSSTKTMTGHTLGAAGAIEAGLAWLLLSDANAGRQLPPHCADNLVDGEIPSLDLVGEHHRLSEACQAIMSNSFAFGGSNVSVILARHTA